MKREIRLLNCDAVLVALMTIQTTVGALVIPHGGPHISNQSRFFSVKVNGQAVFTHSFMGYDYAHFAFSELAKVEVTFNEDITNGVVVTPSKYGVQPSIHKNTFGFSLEEPRKLFIRVNVPEAPNYWASANDHHFLVLFADPLEEKPPVRGAPNVVCVASDDAEDATPSIQAAIAACPQGGTVFIPSGKYPVNSPVFLNKPGITLYLEGGAFIQRASGPRAIVVEAHGVTIKGRGTIEAKSSALSTGRNACNRFVLEGIVLRDSYISAHGEFHLIAKMSLNDFRITNVKGLGCPQNETYGKQRDGIVISDSLNGLVDDIFVWSGDDSFYVQAGDFEHPQRNLDSDVKTENIVVKNSLFRAEGGAASIKDKAVRPIVNLQYLDCVSLKGKIEVDSRAETGLQEGILFKNIEIEEQASIGIAKLFSTEFMDAPVHARFENITFRKFWPGRNLFIVRASPRVKVDFENLVVNGKVITGTNELTAAGFKVTWEGAPWITFSGR